MPAKTRNVQKVGTTFVKILAYLEQPKTKTPRQVITTTNEKQTLLPSSNAGAMEQEKAAAKKSPEFCQSRGKCSKPLDFFSKSKELNVPY